MSHSSYELNLRTNFNKILFCIFLDCFALLAMTFVLCEKLKQSLRVSVANMAIQKKRSRTKAISKSLYTTWASLFVPFSALWKSMHSWLCGFSTPWRGTKIQRSLV